MDLVMTRKGRQLYARGKFKPSYYKFYDENIIYEASNQEMQNQISERIKTSLYERPLVAETGLLDTDGRNEPEIPMLHNELGTYAAISSSAPAWEIEFKDATYDVPTFSEFPNQVYMLTSVEGSTDSQLQASCSVQGINTFEERIPQFNMNVDLTYYTNVAKMGDTGQVQELYEDENNKDIFLNIVENNSFSPVEMQDLEIEVYKIVDVNDKTKRLAFISTTASLSPLIFSDKETGAETVENYLNILFDNIALQQNNLKTKNIYTGIVDDPDLCEPEI